MDYERHVDTIRLFKIHLNLSLKKREERKCGRRNI